MPTPTVVTRMPSLEWGMAALRQEEAYQFARECGATAEQAQHFADTFKPNRDAEILEGLEQRLADGAA